MDLLNFYKRSKKKLTDTIGGLGAAANTYRKQLSNWGNNPANTPDWLKKVDTGLRSFSRSAENVPKFDFAKKVENPVGKFGAEMAQGIANIPSRAVSTTFKDYGKISTKPSYLVKRGAEAASVGVDAGSLFGGGKIAKDLVKTGIRQAGKRTVGQVFKQGAKRGAKEGLAYGATSGALTGLQEGENLKEQGKNALKTGVMGGVMGVVAGGVLGGVIPAAGHEAKTLVKDVKNFKNPYAKRVVTKYKTEPTGSYAPGGVMQTRDIPNSARKVVETVKLPFKPQSMTGKFLTSKAGLSVEDVNMQKPRVVSGKDLDARIAQKRANAKAIVGKQIINQKVGSDVAERGFVAPQAVEAPKKKDLLPSIDDFVSKKTQKPSTAELLKNHQNSFKPIKEFLKESFGNTETPIAMSEKGRAYRDYVSNFKQKEVALENQLKNETKQTYNLAGDPRNDDAIIQKAINEQLPKTKLVDKALEKIKPEWRTDYSMIKDDLNKIVKEEAEYMMSLKDEMGGVGKYKKIGEGEIGGDTGLRRFSSNPGWYRDFYKKNGRAPRKWEVIKIAEENLKNGNGMNVQKFNDLRRVLLDMETASFKASKIKSSEDIFKTGPYNKYQQRAFDKKAERIEGIDMLLNYPQKLIQYGYKKREIDRIGKDQAEKILRLAGLGYPRKYIDKIIQNIPTVKKIIEKKVSWGDLNNYYTKKKALNTNFLDGVDPAGLKDINPLMGSARDAYRNFDVVFGDNSKVKKEVLGTLDKAKGNFIDEQESRLGDLWDEVVKKYGIKEIKTFFGFKYGDRSSEYVQKVGENVLLRPLRESDIPKNIKQQIKFEELKSLAEKSKNGDWRILVGKKLEELPDAKKEVILTQLKKIAPKNWDKIVNAVSWFRSKFDEMLPELNKVREATYPTHPLYPESTKVIPFRKNYFPHSLEREGIMGLKNLFDTPANIDPSLAVMSEYTKPKTKFLGFAQRRTGNKTDYDAVKGMKNYIRDFAFAKHIDPQIQKLRGMDEEAKELIKNSHGAIPERIGLAEELSRKFDPIQQITDLEDPMKIQKILTDHGMSEKQSGWMSKELANIVDYEKVKTFIKEKTAKNKEDIFGKMVPSATAEGADNKLNNFLKFLDNYASDLAGKTNPFDRPNQDVYSRKAFKLLRTGLSRIKSNAVLGNVGSAVSQFFSLPPGIASAGTRNTMKGIKDSLVGVFKNDLPIKNSNFLKERYFDGTSRFDESFLATPKKFASWMMTFGDEVSAKLIWNSHYRKALSEKISDPVSYADDWTRRIVGGRGIGEVPLMQKSLMYQVTNPFQLEVTNYWYALRDLAKHSPKKLTFAKKLVEAFVIGHIMNRVVKEVRGSDVIFDPIQAMIDGYNEYDEEENKKLGLLKTGGRMVGEFISNAPGLPSLPTGQTIANMYPEYGKEVFGYKLPARSQLFGEGDPTRFGSGGISDVITGGIQDPVYKIIPPFGGSQIKKTIGGVKTLLNGYAENNTGKVMTPVNRDITNVMRGALFGKNAVGEVQDYYDENKSPLSDLQTEKYKLMGNDQRYFDSVANDRKADNEKEKIKGGKVSGESRQLSDDIYQLSNGKFYAKSLNSEFDTAEKAEREIIKEEFRKSDENFKDLGDRILRKSEDGTVSDLSKTKFNSMLNSANLVLYKKNENLDGWIETADKQFDILNQMILDPSVDELEKVEIQSKIETLTDDYQKFTGYGGFTKPKAAKKLEEKWRYPLIDPEFMRIQAMIAGTTPRKARISRRPSTFIRKRPPVVRRRSRR